MLTLAKYLKEEKEESKSKKKESKTYTIKELLNNDSSDEEDYND